MKRFTKGGKTQFFSQRTNANGFEIQDIEGSCVNVAAHLSKRKGRNLISPLRGVKIRISTYPTSAWLRYIIFLNKFTSALSIFDMIRKQFAGASLTDFTYS